MHAVFSAYETNELQGDRHHLGRGNPTRALVTVIVDWGMACPNLGGQTRSAIS